MLEGRFCVFQVHFLLVGGGLEVFYGQLYLQDWLEKDGILFFRSFILFSKTRF